MNQSRAELQLSRVWADPDIEEVVVHAASTHFSGATSLYVAPGDIAKLAGTLRGFPLSRDDQRTFELGQSDLSGYGRVRGKVYCRDSTGHIGVLVEIFQSPSDARDRNESCTVLLKVVPADLDRFVDEVRLMGEQVAQMATLASAT